MGSSPDNPLSARPPVTVTPSQLIELQKLATAKRIQVGANWFFWIAGLSLVNSVIALAGGGTRFVLGLGITQVVDAIAQQANMGKGVPLVVDLVAAGIFVPFGLQARKRQNWAFLVGMILYALDGLLFVLVKDILGIGFHLFALFFIYKGMKANEQLGALERGALP
ncbi:MAG: hypothetical protein ABSG54_10810 [Terriglobia bacterium]